MRAILVFIISIVCRCSCLFAAEELSNWDQLPSGNRFVEFIVKNRPFVVNLTNVDSINPLQVLGLEVTDASPTEWATLGAKLKNVRSLKVTTSATDLTAQFFLSLTNYPRLEYLHLKCQKALAIPPQVSFLSNLPHLRYLGLDAPAAVHIDDGIYRSSTLEELYLVVGAVKIPNGIARLSNLENLVINGKRTLPIKKMPADLQHSRISRLEFAIVPEIGEMLTSLPTNLVEFRVVRCGLKSVPKTWLAHSKMMAINLNGNQLTEFPVDLLSIPSLNLVGLELNNITNVPPLKVAVDRKLKISLIANPIRYFAPENEPLVERGVIER
jgi:hypothetical protein